MRKASSQGSQRFKRRDNFPSWVSILTPKVLGFLTAVLGTACTLAFASKPPLTAKLATNAQTQVNSSLVQPLTSPTALNSPSLSDRSINKDATIFPGLRSPIDSSQSSKKISEISRLPHLIVADSSKSPFFSSRETLSSFVPPLNRGAKACLQSPKSSVGAKPLIDRSSVKPQVLCLNASPFQGLKTRPSPQKEDPLY